jgi:nucleoside-diphosphate-sugar epimerase
LFSSGLLRACGAEDPGTRALIRRHVGWQVYNIGSPFEISMKELAVKLIQELGLRPEGRCGAGAGWSPACFPMLRRVHVVYVLSPSFGPVFGVFGLQ